MTTEHIFLVIAAGCIDPTACPGNETNRPLETFEFLSLSKVLFHRRLVGTICWPEVIRDLELKRPGFEIVRMYGTLAVCGDDYLVLYSAITETSNKGKHI